MASIFISYSSKNRSKVEQLADTLTKMGYSVLYDQQILAGQPWWDKILNDIEASSVFIYALSPEYVDSYPCDLEYKYAQALSRYMLPVMIEPVDFKQVPSSIALTQALHYTNLQNSQSLQLLVRALNDLSQKPAPVVPVPAPPRPPAPISLLNSVIDKITDLSITLSQQEQETLLADIRRFIYKPETRSNARYALERYRKRTDLMATVADEIDSLIALSSGAASSPMPIAQPTPRSRSPHGIRRFWRWLIVVIVGVLVLGGGRLLISQFLWQNGSTAPPMTTQANIAQNDTPTVQTTVLPVPNTAPPTQSRLPTPSQTHAIEPSTATGAGSYTPVPQIQMTAPPTLPLSTALSAVTANAQWKPQFKTFDGIEMALVPPGCFIMGNNDSYENEKPVKKQCFDTAFWIDKTDVTQAQFKQWNGVAFRVPYFKGDNRPIENVTWIEAYDFCAKRHARLPTEPEWEYAARGPDNLIYPWGNNFDSTKVVYKRTEDEGTANVGSIQSGASWVGALDMSGEVWQWVNTLYKPYPYDTADGRDNTVDRTGQATYSLRGGSWYVTDPTLLRTTYRFEHWNSGWVAFGFRCARSSGQVSVTSTK